MNSWILHALRYFRQIQVTWQLFSHFRHAVPAIINLISRLQCPLLKYILQYFPKITLHHLYDQLIFAHQCHEI